MSDLTFVEKKALEEILEMSGGYVLDFSNYSFREFIQESIKINIESSDYCVDGSLLSKAKRLRELWKKESNHVVGKLAEDLLSYKQDSSTLSITPEQIQRCEKIIKRLSSTSSAEFDSLKFDLSDREIQLLRKNILYSISQNDPDAALDRLHTYVSRCFKDLCLKVGLSTKNKINNEEKPLHSLAGEYIKFIDKTGIIESRMTLLILKSSLASLDAFNDIRNNKSLAHVNSLLGHDESLLIFNYIITTLSFIEKIEQKRLDNRKDLPDKLRSSILLSEIVKTKVSLKQGTKEYSGLCPFHNEKTPSFTVNDQKGFYHCFGCGAHGDIIGFVMNVEKIGFKEAIIKLVNKLPSITDKC